MAFRFGVCLWAALLLGASVNASPIVQRQIANPLYFFNLYVPELDFGRGCRFGS